MLYTSDFVAKEIKGRNIISNKQRFLDLFFAPENQDSSKIQTENKTHQDKNLKISSIQIMQNLFSFQAPFKF